MNRVFCGGSGEGWLWKLGGLELGVEGAILEKMSEGLIEYCYHSETPMLTPEQEDLI